MKKSITIHIALLISFFILITITKGWLDLMYLPFWIGGVLGFFLPDLDYVIYHYFLKTKVNPSVDTVVDDVASSNVLKNWAQATENRDEQKLIFHTAHFQMIFVLFAFFVVSSSGSILGRGIVLAFMLHLLVDLMIDWKYKNSLDRWFTKIPFELTSKQKAYYVYGNVILVLLFGLLF